MTHLLSSADINSFSPEISKFFYIKKCRYKLHFGLQVLILQNFFKPLRIVSIDMVTILMMSLKMATLGFLKMKVFWKKVYEVIVFIHDVTKKFLSCASSYMVHEDMWPKFGNSSISMREVIYPQFYKDLIRKTLFNLRDGLGASWVICDWH